jgi:ketosteroid isomerase-like protein
MSFTGPIEDRLAIRELLDVYNDAVARVDADAWRETWAEDAEWELMGTSVSGRDAIVKLWQQTMQQFELVIFQTAPGALEVSGSEATGRVFASEVLQLKDGSRRHVHGRYDDAYTKIGGAWRFKTRRYQVLSQY